MIAVRKNADKWATDNEPEAVTAILRIQGGVAALSAGKAPAVLEFYSTLDQDPNTKHDAATIINARIALSSVDRDWSVAVIGKNLTNEKTSIWNQDVPFTDSNSYFALPNRPRSIAVQARYRF